MVLFDTVIDVLLYQGDASIPWLSISCPDNGPKPKMSLSSTQVQGGICFQTKLTIWNLAVSQPDVRKITRMKITAGYRDGYKTELDCPVLTSYMVAPMPNSQIVISGVAVGSVKGLLSPFKVNLFFTNKDMTVKIKDLVKQSLNALANKGTTIDLSALEKRPDIMNTEIGVPVKSLYADNGLALVNWLNTVLDIATDKTVKLFVYGNSIKAVPVDQVDDDTALQHVVNVDFVTDAKFTGSLLQVSAPWNPEVIPGGVIQMKAHFYAGEDLPNQLTTFAGDLETSSYLSNSLGKWGDKYTVIVMSYTVNTEGTSEMSFSAIRSDSLPPAEFDVTRTVEEYASEIDKELNLAQKMSINDLQGDLMNQTVDIYFPAPEKDDNALIKMYELCSSGGMQQVDIGKAVKTQRDIVAIMEAKMQKGAVLTVDKEMSDKIAKAAHADNLSLNAMEGYQIYTGQLYPFVFGLTYKMYKATGANPRLNPIDTSVPWSLTKHWSSTSIYLPNVSDALNAKAFWKKAISYFPAYSTEWKVCAIIAYS